MNRIKKIALDSCVYYTVSTFLVLFLYFVLNTDLAEGVQPLALIAILPFSILFAIANTIFRHTSLDRWARLLIHYTLTVGGSFLFLYLPNKDPQQTASQSALLFLVFTILYALVMGAVLIVSSRIARVKRDEANYHSVYKK